MMPECSAIIVPIPKCMMTTYSQSCRRIYRFPKYSQLAVSLPPTERMLRQQDSYTTCIPVVRIPTTNNTRTTTIVILFGYSSTLFIQSHYITPNLRDSTLSNSLINLLPLSTSLLVSLFFETIQYLLQNLKV